MLNFAIEHINTISGNRNMKLRQYELREAEWNIVQKLQDILKVCNYFLF